MRYLILKELSGNNFPARIYFIKQTLAEKHILFLLSVCTLVYTVYTNELFCQVFEKLSRLNLDNFYTSEIGPKTIENLILKLDNYF